MGKLLNCCVWLYFCLEMGLADPDLNTKPEYFKILLNEKTIQGHTVNLIEGVAAKLTCVYKNDASLWVQWTVEDTVVSNTSTIETSSLEKGHVASYTCRSWRHELRRTVTVNVLYPPEKAEISGPFVVTKDTPFNLTCSADSNPPASYRWTEDSSCYAPNIGNDATLSVSMVEGNEMVFYCIADNTMVPTNGEPIQSNPVSVKHVIKVQETPEDDSPGNEELVVIAVMGWSVAMVTSAIAIYLFLRKRDSVGAKHQPRYKKVEESGSLLPNISGSFPLTPVTVAVERPLIPERPDMLTLLDRTTANSYLEVLPTEDALLPDSPVFEAMYESLEHHVGTDARKRYDNLCQSRMEDNVCPDEERLSPEGYEVPIEKDYLANKHLE